MLRILIISVVSLCSLFPFMVITTQIFSLSNDTGSAVSAVMAFIVLPIILLNTWKPKPSLDVLPVDNNDPIMSEHIAIARSNLERFFNGLNEALFEAFVKFPHEFEGEIEHVWGIAHSVREDHVIVSLASEPIGEPGEEAMERMSISIKAIEDWMLVSANGETQGGYTMLGMAKIYERDYGKLPKRYAEDLKMFVDLKW
jgi:uncharacterized protein YegJ (DUF2314 family)